MKTYTKITAESVKEEFSQVIKAYIGPKAMIPYKQAARELEVEERTLSSWVRGEKQLNLSSLLKLSLYLPPSFIREVINIAHRQK
jgi:hypothetical protein